MSEFDYGFIGAGNMGTALASAVCKMAEDDKVIISDADTQKAKEAAKNLNCKYGENREIVSNSKFIFLGVKPQVLPQVLIEIAPIIEKRDDECVIVTMAAGIKIEVIEKAIKGNVSVIRIMPNTPVLAGKGMIVYSLNKNVTSAQKSEFLNAFKYAGELDELPEHLIDAASSLSGCGPAFVYMFADALADGAVEAGLPRDKALKYAIQTISGAAELLALSGKHPEELKNAVCSPAGSTINGVHALENGSFRSVCMNAVKSSFERTKELGK